MSIEKKLIFLFAGRLNRGPTREMSTGDGDQTRGDEAMDTDQGLDGVAGLFGRESEANEGPPVAERLKAYLAKKKEEEDKIRAVLKDELRCDWLAYESINKKNKEELVAKKCTEGLEPELPGLGSFIHPPDGRLLTTGMKTEVGNKSVVTTSFDPDTLRCYGCVGHEEKKAWRPRGVQEGQREVFLITDQAYPPALPVNGQGQCIKIVRRENGSLHQLAAELMDLARGKIIERGSLILMFSGSHLARAGTVGYIEDLVAAAASIKAVLGGALKVAPAPPLFLGGCDKDDIIRSCAEVYRWAEDVFGEEDGFMKESVARGYKLLEDATEDRQGDYRRRMRLPASLSPADGKKCWEMGGFNLKKRLTPASPEKEAEVVLALLNEVRSKMAIDLDPTPSFDRKVNTGQTTSARQKKLYLVVGGIDAERLTEALRRKGEIADAVIIEGWKVTPELVEIMVEKIQLAIARRKPDCIIVQCMDDSVYFSMSEDGSILPAKKGDDGKVHIEGRMVLCKGDVQEMMLRRMDPLWVATKGINTIVIIPMVRYITGGCCEDSSHVRNRTEPDFLTKLKKDLEEFRLSLKRQLNGSGRSHCQVMDPTVDLVQLEARHTWGEDPAHPTGLGFDKMVMGVKAMDLRIDERVRAAEAKAAAKRPRLEATGGQPTMRGRGDNRGRGSRRPSEESQGWSRSRRGERHEGPQFGAYDIRRGGRF
jgi:hypothetical protein